MSERVESEKFCKKLEEAIKDEEGATELYQDLVASIGKPTYLPLESTLPREVLTSIMHQERDHESLLKLIHALRCPIK